MFPTDVARAPRAAPPAPTCPQPDRARPCDHFRGVNELTNHQRVTGYSHPWVLTTPDESSVRYQSLGNKSNTSPHAADKAIRADPHSAGDGRKEGRKKYTLSRWRTSNGPDNWANTRAAGRAAVLFTTRNGAAPLLLNWRFRLSFTVRPAARNALVAYAVALRSRLPMFDCSVHSYRAESGRTKYKRGSRVSADSRWRKFNFSVSSTRVQCNKQKTSWALTTASCFY
ncbi:hypothetical protein EVAR_4025_1 [Eumeta japonica]|uniref:Uncharacterized protein n=1 Tax=Eumeta variegata TaxID=151549 RepID=A0A4C1T4W4_EUMVA|nr:hypothetical protein EVAR_4025_1 [Eumeta japonica]